MAKETEEKLKEILGEGVTLGMDSAEEDWDSDGEKPQDSSGVDSWEQEITSAHLKRSQFVCEAKVSYPHLGNLLLLYFIEIKNGKKIENINQFIYNAINQ